MYPNLQGFCLILFILRFIAAKMQCGSNRRTFKPLFSILLHLKEVFGAKYQNKILQMIAILHLAMGREVTVTPKAENGVDSRTSRRIFHHEEQRMSIDSAQRGAARRGALLVWQSGRIRDFFRLRAADNSKCDPLPPTRAPGETCVHAIAVKRNSIRSHLPDRDVVPLTQRLSTFPAPTMRFISEHRCSRLGAGWMERWRRGEERGAEGRKPLK